MDPISNQLYSGAKKAFGLITMFVVIHINWQPVSMFTWIEEEEVFDNLWRYKDALGDYLLSSQWPIFSLVCYLSSIHDLIYLKRRLLSGKVYLPGRCLTYGTCILFTILSLYKWFWLIIGFGIPSFGFGFPDFGAYAIIIMTTCFGCYVAGACEMKQIFLQLVSQAKKRNHRITISHPMDATTAV